MIRDVNPGSEGGNAMGLGIRCYGDFAFVRCVGGENPVKGVIESSRFIWYHEDLGAVHERSGEDFEMQAQL